LSYWPEKYNLNSCAAILFSKSSNISWSFKTLASLISFSRLFIVSTSCFSSAITWLISVALSWFFQKSGARASFSKTVISFAFLSTSKTVHQLTDFFL